MVIQCDHPVPVLPALRIAAGSLALLPEQIIVTRAGDWTPFVAPTSGSVRRNLVERTDTARRQDSRYVARKAARLAGAGSRIGGGP